MIRTVPELASDFLSFEQLGGGLCNKTFRVLTSQKAYVLRINSKQNEYLNLTRHSEIEVMKKAHFEGFSPKVIAGDCPEQFVVTEFIEGRMLEKDDLEDMNIKSMIMQRLKLIHGMEGQDRQCTPYDLIHGYLKGADSFKVKRPDGLNKILNRVEKIA